MENEIKFLNALIKVAKFVEPNIQIVKSEIVRNVHENGVDVKYTISGCDSTQPDKSIAILSRGYVDGGNGRQIEVFKDGKKRMFPFFGFNWEYLKVN